MNINMKMNKTYCPLLFNEIYADSSAQYRLCCHAKITKELFQYSSQTHTPFEYFNSPEMEDKRNLVLAGKELRECKKCYEMEYLTGQSYRTKAFKDLPYTIDKDTGEKNINWPIDIDKVTLKLRINGTYCNLSCYTCIPYNSSSRRNEMNEIYPEGWKWGRTFASIKSKEWDLIVNDIIENIDKVSVMHITGGEPLQLPKHWEMLNRIPDEYAKQIELHYDTNFTKLQYKNQHVRDIENRFKLVYWGISCDHYGEKLEYIRYPINVEEFENNLLDTKDFKFKGINVTTSILNIEDLLQIKEYYVNNFNLVVKFTSVVMAPKILSIRNLPEKKKEVLINLYKNRKDRAGNDEFIYVISELKKSGNSHNLKEGIKYIRKLSKHRNMNHVDLWPQYI